MTEPITIVLTTRRYEDIIGWLGNGLSSGLVETLNVVPADETSHLRPDKRPIAARERARS